VYNSPILGSLGNLDRFSANRSGTDYEACALRVYDPKTGDGERGHEQAGW
jgi:hypothetical protein